ncbi:hypothetical protein LRAMOSA08989 [Lichtheimia ramosa]|uniref:F-box domain-containing protein n=1 Tax=Lichtheimia ramosa TaxID=688394 RepID=A0A077WFQ7_9FUNG|nr:hypothetical protein LRAMOSA08989 [Lichtheimia ramosa]
MDTSILSIPTITSYHQQGDKAISTATDEIDQLACQLMEKLDGRATALANGAQFELALRDATFIRTLAPRSSLGYLTAGYIYRQQGRQQEAVAMYDQGLVNVPISDVCYTNLQLERADAANAASKRIDFITQLPLELVTAEILPLVFKDTPLQPDTPCPYLYVSHAWQQVILRSNNLDFYIDRKRCTLPDHDDQLARFAPYVKSLTIADCASFDEEDEDRRYTLPPIFEYYRFQCITHLKIGYNVDEKQEVMIIVESLGDALTHLDLDNWDVLDMGVSLGFVLDHCPNLTSLVLANSEICALSDQHRNLTHLNLHWIRRCPVSDSTTGNILAHLPSLVSFKITPMPNGTQFIARIQGYCPNMKILSTGNALGLEDGCPHGRGLQKLSFGNRYRKNPYDADTMIQLLVDNQQSVSELLFNGSITSTRASLDQYTPITFEQLQYLDLDASNDALVVLGKSIIRHAPYLRNVDINIQTTNDHDVFDAMTGLQHLQRIAAECVAPNSTSFHHLLVHHIQLGPLSSLKELVIDFAHDIWASPWVCAISGLPNLQRLVITTFASGVPSTYLMIMEVLAKGCGSLTYLELNCGGYTIPEGAVTKWMNHPNVLCLRVQTAFLSDSDIFSVISIPKLRRFILQAPVQDYIIKVLEQNITHVRIEEDDS